MFNRPFLRVSLGVAILLQLVYAALAHSFAEHVAYPAPRHTPFITLVLLGFSALLIGLRWEVVNERVLMCASGFVTLGTWCADGHARAFVHAQASTQDALAQAQIVASAAQILSG